MKLICLCSLLLLISNPTNAATWYIRPAGATFGAGNGTSYTNAFSGFTSALNSIPVNAGDVVYICGAHYEQITWRLSGAPNAPVVVDFACPGDPGSIDTVAAGHPYAVYGANISFVTFTNMRLLGALRTGIRIDATTQNVTDVKVTASYIDNGRASDPSLVCHAVYISPAGTAYRFYNIEISRNTIPNVSRACFNGNNDGINFEGGIAGNVISHNTINRAHEGIDVSSAGTQISFNTLKNNYYSGIKVHGIIQCPTALLVYNNLISNNTAWGLIFQDATSSIVANNTVNQPNGTFSALQIDQVNNCDQKNNTYTSNILVSKYNAGVVRIYDETKIAFESQNNWNGNTLYQTATTSLVYLNMDLANNITTANFATKWRPAHSRDLISNPALNATTLRLPGGSPHAGSGITF